MEEAVSKGNILYGSIFRTFSERQSYRTGEQISGCQGPGDREGATTKGEHGGLFGATELSRVMVAVTQIDPGIQIQRTGTSW